MVTVITMVQGYLDWTSERERAYGAWYEPDDRFIADIEIEADVGFTPDGEPYVRNLTLYEMTPKGPMEITENEFIEYNSIYDIDHAVFKELGKTKEEV